MLAPIPEPGCGSGRRDRLGSARSPVARRLLTDLRGVAPIYADEAKSLVEKKDLVSALDRIESAIRQVPNEAEYYNLRGNILQSLLRWDEAKDSYEEALERSPGLESATLNLELTKKLLASTPDDPEPTTGELKLLEESLIKQQRLAEAGALVDQFGPDGPLVIKVLRELVENDPKLGPFLPLFRGAQLKSRFLYQPDGTYSANLRGFPPPTYEPLLKNQVLSVSGVVIDAPDFSDLSIFSGMKLRSLSLGGCLSVADLSPLRGMKLQVLHLSRTGVVDLSPLAGMPLVELNLEGCTGIADFTPLKDCLALEKLLLPRNARAVGFLRALPKLKFVGYKGFTQPAGVFWAEFENRKGAAKFNPPENPLPPPPKPFPPPGK